MKMEYSEVPSGFLGVTSIFSLSGSTLKVPDRFSHVFPNLRKFSSTEDNQSNEVNLVGRD